MALFSSGDLISNTPFENPKAAGINMLICGALGDDIKIETTPASNGTVEFGDVLAVSGSEGQVGRSQGARVVGSVVGEGRGDKVLVFHYKRKKQYKKLRGHRQAFTSVRIAEIAFGGQSFKAPDLPKKEAKPKKVKQAAAEEHEEHEAKPKAKKKSAPKKAAKKAAKKK
jgi:large subunit ribosomal protein L21